MKKLLFIFLLSAFIFSACSKSSPTPTKDPFPIYKTTKSTYLYEEPDADSKTIISLFEGQEVKPADGALSLYCQSVNLGGGDYAKLCKVQLLSIDRTGWVLEKWIKKVN